MRLYGLYKWAGPVAEILLERGKILLTGMKISPYKHSQAGYSHFNLLSKQYQNNKIFPASGVKFSHIDTREIHPAYRAVSLSGPAQLPYKQALIVQGFMICSIAV